MHDRLNKFGELSQMICIVHFNRRLSKASKSQALPFAGSLKVFQKDSGKIGPARNTFPQSLLLKTSIQNCARNTGIFQGYFETRNGEIGRIFRIFCPPRSSMDRVTDFESLSKGVFLS